MQNKIVKNLINKYVEDQFKKDIVKVSIEDYNPNRCRHCGQGTKISGKLKMKNSAIYSYDAYEGCASDDDSFELGDLEMFDDEDKIIEFYYTSNVLEEAIEIIKKLDEDDIVSLKEILNRDF